jgi:hypothetical protein
MRTIPHEDIPQQEYPTRAIPNKMKFGRPGCWRAQLFLFFLVVDLNTPRKESISSLSAMTAHLKYRTFQIDSFIYYFRADKRIKKQLSDSPTN